jgi:hypothetical protein
MEQFKLSLKELIPKRMLNEDESPEVAKENRELQL